MYEPLGIEVEDVEDRMKPPKECDEVCQYWENTGKCVMCKRKDRVWTGKDWG